MALVMAILEALLRAQAHTRLASAAAPREGARGNATPHEKCTITWHTTHVLSSPIAQVRHFQITSPRENVLEHTQLGAAAASRWSSSAGYLTLPSVSSWPSRRVSAPEPNAKFLGTSE